MRFGKTIFTLVGICSIPTLAFADDVAAAKELFDQGFAHMQAHEYDVGCKQIAESLKLDRRPGTLFTLATCEFEWGRLATADTRYQEFLRLYDSLPDQEKPKQEPRAVDAREKRAAIANDIPRWTLTLAPGSPANTEVRRNGDQVGEAMLGMEMPVDPGVYVLTTQAPGGPVTEKRIEIVKGTKATFVLDVAPVPITKPTPPNQDKLRRDSPMPPRRVAGWALVGTGGALLGGGLIAGVIAFSKKDVIERNCGAVVGASGAPTTCSDTGKAAGESATLATTVADVGVIAGIVGIVGGVILVATTPKTTMPNTAFARPSVNVNVWSAGLSGAMGGVHGTW